jgi:hypothetical protein
MLARRGGRFSGGIAVTGNAVYAECETTATMSSAGLLKRIIPTIVRE